MEWKEIQPNIWKPEKEGDSIEGTLVSKDTTGTYGSMAYSMETSEGASLVWGSAVLDERMKYAKPGDYIKIEYKGTEKNKKGQDVKIFKVFKGSK